MAALLSITVANPADVLQAYGAGAVVQVYRGTTDDVGDASTATTIAVVAGTTAYEYADATGIAGTHRYFIRYEKATVDSSDDVSGWTGPLLAGALAGGPLTVELVRTWGNVPTSDTADDAWRPIAIAAINRAGVKACNVDLGSSPDTVRVYDDSITLFDQYRRRMYVPGGIRSFVTVEHSSDGTTWTDITSSVRIGPVTFARPSGEPGDYIEFLVTTSGSFLAHVRITVTAFAGFGWDAWPMDLTQDALSAYERLALDKARGGQYPTEIAALRYLHLPLWHSYRDRWFPRVR